MMSAQAVGIKTGVYIYSYATNVQEAAMEAEFVLNAVHSREGCYTYIKEIVDGNSIIVLAEEEQEALKMAMESNDSAPKTK